MNYIVLDLEWNQCPAGKAEENADLRFEIIEIGAVKLDGTLTLTDRFREVVRPQVYHSLHHRTREIISLRAIDFEGARSFPEVARDFISWCGEDALFCTWGSADLTELQQNLSYYDMPSPFPFPLLYYDIQKIFSIVYEDRRSRRSLESAVDFLDIPKNIPFHSALSDAHYTSLIMQSLTPEQILSNSSVDYYRTPENRRQEIYLSYETYSKFVSRPFRDKVQAMRDRAVISTPCCKCAKTAQKRIRWFPVGGSNYFCLAHCEEHGYLKGKIRLRHRRDNLCYAIRTVKTISPEEAYEIREKKEVLKLKRRLRRKFNNDRTP